MGLRIVDAAPYEPDKDATLELYERLDDLASHLPEFLREEFVLTMRAMRTDAAQKLLERWEKANGWS